MYWRFYHMYASLSQTNSQIQWDSMMFQLIFIDIDWYFILSFYFPFGINGNIAGTQKLLLMYSIWIEWIWWNSRWFTSIKSTSFYWDTYKSLILIEVLFYYWMWKQTNSQIQWDSMMFQLLLIDIDWYKIFHLESMETLIDHLLTYIPFRLSGFDGIPGDLHQSSQHHSIGIHRNHRYWLRFYFVTRYSIWNQWKHW